MLNATLGVGPSRLPLEPSLDINDLYLLLLSDKSIKTISLFFYALPNRFR